MPLIILSAILFFLLLIQAIFYILPAFALRKNDVEKSNATLPPVSVIIACRNELQNLKSNLQYIINQQYPEFEIVIVDDNSTDGTSDYIAELAKTFPNVKLVENKESGKKSALSYGIRAATYEHLIFTDADCRPATEHWIAGIMSQFDAENPLVLGYGELSGKTFAARFSSYDATLIALQYLGFASLGHTYMAVGRNIAYSRKLWDTLGGFGSHSDIASGDDDLFVRDATKHIRPTVCVSSEAKTISPAKETFAKLLRQKSRHISTSGRYSLADKFLSGGEIVSRTLFFAMAIAMLFVNWKFALAFVIVRLVFVMLSLAKFCSTTKTDFNLFMLLIFDIFAPIFYVALMFYGIFNRETKW
jgi:glycosyltransferase involved in cell wall biosynthesis